MEKGKSKSYTDIQRTYKNVMSTKYQMASKFYKKR